jgi:hypothetical protein
VTRALRLPAGQLVEKVRDVFVLQRFGERVDGDEREDADEGVFKGLHKPVLLPCVGIFAIAEIAEIASWTRDARRRSNACHALFDAGGVMKIASGA